MSCYDLLRILPKNYISYLAGKLSRIEFPRFLSQFMIRSFIRRYNINLDEIEKAPEDYGSLNEFFTRHLCAGAREIEAGLVSPVDGKIVQFGQIQDSKLIQVKGREYSLQGLVVDKDLAKIFEGGYFITIYLSPSNYHRIHSPVEGEIEKCVYVPGRLWPVNSWSLENIKDLFVVNERVITVINSAEAGKVAVVKVGATNVGSITVEFDDVRSNPTGFSYFKKPIIKRYDQQLMLKKGQMLGTFNMGSTVILLMQKTFYPKYNLSVGDVLLGARLGDYS